MRTSGPAPPPRSSLAAVAVGHCIFVHGGEGPEASTRAKQAGPQAGLRSVSRAGAASDSRQGAHGAEDAALELFGDVHVLDTRSMTWSAARPNAVIADFSEDLLQSSMAVAAPAQSPVARQGSPSTDVPPLLIASPSNRALKAADARERHRLLRLVATLASPLLVAGVLNALRQHYACTTRGTSPEGQPLSDLDVRDVLAKMVKSRDLAAGGPDAAPVQAGPLPSPVGRRSQAQSRQTGRTGVSGVSGSVLPPDHPYRHTALRRARGGLLLLPELMADAAVADAAAAEAAAAAVLHSATAALPEKISKPNMATELQSFARVDIGVPVPDSVVAAVAGDSSLMLQLCNQLASALSPLAAVPEPRHAHTLVSWAVGAGACPLLVLFGGMSRSASLSSANMRGGLTSSASRRNMQVPNNDVQLFDVNAGVWMKLPIAGDSAPAPRGYHAAVMLGNRLVVFGGLGDSGVLGDVWALDLTPLAHLHSLAGSVVQARVNEATEAVLGMHGLTSKRGSSLPGARGSGGRATSPGPGTPASNLPACSWTCLFNAPGPAELAMQVRHRRVTAMRSGLDMVEGGADVGGVERDMTASAFSTSQAVGWQGAWGPGAVFGHRMVVDPWDPAAVLVGGGRSWTGEGPATGAAPRATALGAMQVWRFDTNAAAWSPVPAPGENRTSPVPDTSGLVVAAVLRAQAFHAEGGTALAAGELPAEEAPPEAPETGDDEGKDSGGASESKDAGAAAEPGARSESRALPRSVSALSALSGLSSAAPAPRAQAEGEDDLPPPLFGFGMLSLWPAPCDVEVLQHWRSHTSVVFGARAAVGMRITQLAAAVTSAPAGGDEWGSPRPDTPKQRGAQLALPAGAAQEDAVTAAVPAPTPAAVGRGQARRRAAQVLGPALLPLLLSAEGDTDGWSNQASSRKASAALKELLGCLDSLQWTVSGHGFRVEAMGQGWFRVPPAGYGGPFCPRGDLGKRVRVSPLRHLGERGLALGAAYDLSQEAQGEPGSPGSHRRVSTAGAARAVLATISARSLVGTAEQKVESPTAGDGDKRAQGEGGLAALALGALRRPSARAPGLASGRVTLADLGVSEAEARTVPGGRVRRLFDPTPEERIQLLAESLFRRVVVLGGVRMPSSRAGVAPDQASSRQGALPSVAEDAPAREVSKTDSAATHGVPTSHLSQALQGVLARREGEDYDAWFKRANDDPRLSDIWRHRQALAEQRSLQRRRGRPVDGEVVVAPSCLQAAKLASKGGLSQRGFLPLTSIFHLCCAPPALQGQPDASGVEDRPATGQGDAAAVDGGDNVDLPARRLARIASAGLMSVSEVTDEGAVAAALLQKGRRTQELADVRRPDQLRSLRPPSVGRFRPHEAPVVPTPGKAAAGGSGPASTAAGQQAHARHLVPSALPDTRTAQTLVQILVNEVEGEEEVKGSGRGLQFPRKEPLLVASSTTSTLAALLKRDARADAARSEQVRAILPSAMVRRFPTGTQLQGPVPEGTLIKAAKAARRAEAAASREALAALMGVQTQPVMDSRLNSGAPVVAAEAAMVGGAVRFPSTALSLHRPEDRPPPPSRMHTSATSLGSGVPALQATMSAHQALVPSAAAQDASRPRGLVSPLCMPGPSTTSLGAGDSLGAASSASFLRVPPEAGCRYGMAGSEADVAAEEWLQGASPRSGREGPDARPTTPQQRASITTDDSDGEALPPPSTFLADVASGSISAVDVVPGWTAPPKAADIVAMRQREARRLRSRGGSRAAKAQTSPKITSTAPSRALAIAPMGAERQRPSRVLHPALVQSMKASVRREQTKQHRRDMQSQRGERGTAQADSAGDQGRTLAQREVLGAPTSTIELGPPGGAPGQPAEEGGGVSPRFTVAGASALLHVERYAGDLEAFGGSKDAEEKGGAGAPVRARPGPEVLLDGQVADVNEGARRGIGGSIPFSAPPRQRSAIVSPLKAGGKAGASLWLSAADVVVAERSKRAHPGVSAAAAAATGDGLSAAQAAYVGEGKRAGKRAGARVPGDVRGFVTPRSEEGGPPLVRAANSAGVGRSLRARGTAPAGRSLLSVHQSTERTLRAAAHGAASAPRLRDVEQGMDDETVSELAKYGMFTLKDTLQSRVVPALGSRRPHSSRAGLSEAMHVALGGSDSMASVGAGKRIKGDSDVARAASVVRGLEVGDTGAGLRSALQGDSDSDEEPLGRTQAGDGGAQTAKASHSGSKFSMAGPAGSVAPGFASAKSLEAAQLLEATTRAAAYVAGKRGPTTGGLPDAASSQVRVHGVTTPARIKALRVRGAATSTPPSKQKRDPNAAKTGGREQASAMFVAKQPVLSAFDKPMPRPSLSTLRKQMQEERRSGAR